MPADGRAGGAVAAVADGRVVAVVLGRVGDHIEQSRPEHLGRAHHATVERALTLARAWCAGHVIDGGPALAHALRMARVLVLHLPDAAPGLVAAVQVHDAPYLAPPAVDDVYSALTAHLGEPVAEVVRALDRENKGTTVPVREAGNPYDARPDSSSPHASRGA